MTTPITDTSPYTRLCDDLEAVLAASPVDDGSKMLVLLDLAATLESDVVDWYLVRADDGVQTSLTPADVEAEIRRQGAHDSPPEKTFQSGTSFLPETGETR